MFKLLKFIIPLLLAVPLWAQGPGGGGAQNITAQRALTRTVAALPAAGSAGRIYIVTDGTDKSDCTVGGSTTRVLCIDDGTNWTSASGAGSATTVDGESFELSDKEDGDVICYDGVTDNRYENCVTGLVSRVDSDGTVALASTDRGKAVYTGHATANAISIAQAGTAGFEAAFFTYTCTTGAGLSTITPATSTINGSATLTLAKDDCALVISDGTNYRALIGRRTFTGYIDLDAATCVGASAANNWDDSPTLTEPAAACLSYTSTTFGVSDFDAATDEGYQVKLYLPADWDGALDADFVWHAAATSGATAWAIQVACAAVDDPFSVTFNTASVVSDTAIGTTNEMNVASVTAITSTGCAAGELMFVQVYRDGDGTGATDDMTGDARLLKVRLKYRRLTVQ